MNISIRKLWLVILLSVAGMSMASGQYYTIGSEPAGLKWRQLNGDHYKVIYPQEVDSLARLYLYKMELMRPLIMEPLNIDPPKQPVILHTQTTISNGSVAVAPTRVDLYTSPDAYNVIPMPWIDCLVTHELRHTGQDDHFTKGIYHPLSYILGEQVYGAGMGLFITSHELEGDAVMSETELSLSGRGRKADFVQHIRAMFLNGEYRNYKQMKFGSFHKQTPNKYVLGFLCETASRLDTEDYFYMGKRLDATARGFQEVKNVFLKPEKRPFDSWADIYQRSTELFTEKWVDDTLSRAPFSQYETIPLQAGRSYVDYFGAIHINDSRSPLDGSVITVKNGLLYPSELISIDRDGEEHHLGYFSNYASTLSNPVNGRIYWSETVYTGTASLRNYSVVRYFDYYDKSFGTISRNTKYFNPAPNKGGDKIAVAEYPVEGSTFLTIISPSGELLSRVEAPYGGQIVESAFIGDDIYCTIILDTGMAIYRYSGECWSEVQPQQSQTISSFRSNGDNLYFTSDLDGLNNIYRYSPDDDQLLCMTNSRYGADYPFIEDDTLYYCEFSLDGFRPVKVGLEETGNKPASFSTPAAYPFIDVLEQQRLTQSVAVMESSASKYLDKTITQSAKYSQLGHAIHIHSWAPVYYNVDNILAANFDQLYSVAAPGATVYSQNEIGNIVTMLGYSYHDGRHAGHFKTTANVLNMTFELSTDYNDRVRKDYCYDTTYTTKTNFLNMGVKAYKSIRLNRGGWNRTLTPLVQFSFNNDTYLQKNLSRLRFGLTYAQTLPISRGQIFPRWGFGLSASVTEGISKLKTSRMNYTYAYFYLPGIIRSQGLKLTSTWQWHRNTAREVRLNTIATSPRGYKDILPNDRFFKATADYAISIYAGDIDLKVLYLQRFQFIPFFDYAVDYNQALERDRWTEQYSFGCDMMANFHLFEFMPNFKAGVRYARTPLLSDKNHFELLFSMDL